MTEESLIEESANAESHEGKYVAKKLRIFLMLLAYSAVMGVIACFVDVEDRVISFFLGLPVLFLGVWWCFIDSEERGTRIGILFGCLLVLLFVVGFPIYVFRTRGVRGFVTLGLAILLFGLMMICGVLMAIFTVLLVHQLGF